MGLRQRSRRFVDMTLSEVVRRVAEAYFPDVQIELDGDPSFDENGIRQAQQTDLAFLLALAEEFACELLAAAGLDAVSVERMSSAELDRPAPRPAYSVLDCSRLTAVRGRPLPPYRDALRRYLEEEEQTS